MINNKQCIRCINDKTVKHITFNQNGLCSHCTCYDKYRSDIKDYERLKKLFVQKLSIPGEFDYDAVVGFSGGKDSTYVLYKLVKEYKLHIKAFTLDNGFLSQEAKNKIDRIIAEIGVEHEYVLCDFDLLKRTYKHIVSKYLSPCIACSFLGYATMINYASKVNARVCIHGRSTYQMFRGLSDSSSDVFRPFIDAGLKEGLTDVETLYSELLNKLDLLVDKKLAKDIKQILLTDSVKNEYRDFVAYFLYHPYDHREIIDYLENNTAWKVETESEHFDCLIHHGALYLKNMIARRSHLMPEYSVMINEGIISKEQALSLMQDTPDPQLAKKELRALCSYANINYSMLMLKAKLYSKRWW